MTSLGFVVVSQSQTLARGLCEVVAPMAPDITIYPCGCHDEGLATASELISDAVDEVRKIEGNDCPIVLMADFGSARLAAQQVVSERADRQIVLGRGPFVEGTSAGVVAAQQGDDIPAIIRAIAGAAQFFPVSEAEVAEIATPLEPKDPLAPRDVQVNHPEGLHARPAALVARLACDFDARITIDGADATSVLALMRLGVDHGDHVVLAAEGPEADIALEKMASAMETGLGTATQDNAE